MYKIMLVKKRYEEELDSLYGFLLEQNEDGSFKPVEFETKAELKIFIEDLLNTKKYSKDDFIIVTLEDYEIDTDINE